MGYELVTGNSAYNADYSHSNSMSTTRISSAGTTTTITINNLSGSYGHLILGATGNATNNTFYISRIVVTTPTGCSSYSFHTGTGEDATVKTTNTQICFTQVGSSNEWQITNYTIPSDTKFFVGKLGYFYDSSLGSNNSRSVVTNWATAMYLAPAMDASDESGTPKVGSSATGAKGTLRIYDNSSWNNLYVAFVPDGYGITYGGTGYAFNTTATSNMYETDVVTLPNCTTTYNVGLKTATAGTYVKYGKSKSTDEALSAMGVTIQSSGKKKILLVPGSFNAAGAKYVVYDITNTAFDTDFMTDADGDGVYEGYVGSNCTSMILCRMSSSATTSDLSSKNWGAKWNQTADISIGDLLQKYEITSLSGDNCSYTTTAMHPVTGDKGKFRIWNNSKSDNFYVHWIPYYVLSYDGNGGTGSTAQTERNCESSTTTVTVASNGFTRTGYTFKGWATSKSRADAGTVDYAAGASYTLTANATLYAVWTANQYSVTHTLSNVTKSSGATGSNAATYGTDYTATFAASSGYELPSTVTVTAGGSDITASCTWTKATGTVSIPGASITGNIVITVTGVEAADFRMVADASAESDATLSHDDAITAGNKNCLTLSGGTAKYIATDGSQTMKVEKPGTTYGWYFGSNKNTIQITLSGHLLQTGSTITIYGHSAADKGFAINGVTTVTNTGADGAFNGTYTVLSSDADLINKNVLTITRVGGSSIRMYSITISNCKSGTICVTPVLPSLTTPNQGCTTSDFATWNATVTNASAISAASGSQSVSYSWKNSSSVEVATTASYKPTAAGTYTVTATVHSDASGYIDATATSSTLTASLYTATSISTQPTTAVDAEEGENFTLGTGMVAAGQGTKTYQWYSYTSSGGAGEASISGASSATYTTSKAAAGTYYYKVKVTVGCGTVASNMITVTVTETPCLRATITKSSDKYSLSGGETKDITSDATVTSGGAVKLVNYNADSKNFSFSDNGVAPGTNDGYVEVVLPSGSALDEGSVIRITGSGTEDGAGLLLIDDAGTTIASQTNNGAIDFSYTVTSSSTLKYLNHIRIKRATGTSKNHFKSVTITGCIDCTPITPTLSYSATTLYLEGGANTATPTLTGNTGSGAVTYSSSNTSAVKVNASTGVITAVAPGTAIITATIAPSGDYCGATKNVTITVPSLVQQTVNLDAAWTTVPNMTFPGDPTSTLTKNANVAATGYAIDESNNKSGLSSKIYNVPSSTSKNDSYYMSLEFNTPSYGVRLTKVVVPIQPIAQTVSAIVTVSDGTTTVTSNEVADIEASKKKTCTFTITPTTFAAGKTITVKIFVYDQTTGTNGFRLGSPILVNGSVITSEFEFTGDGANANWDTPANWNWGIPPTINNDVVIKKPATVNVTNAKAKSIVLDQSSTNTGSLEINAGKELAVAQTVKVWDGSNRIATTVNDIVINSTSGAGLGALVMGTHDGTNKATVNFTTRSAGIKDDNTSIAQYVGTPFNDENNILYNWYNSWVYGITYDGGAIGWERVNEGQGMTPFRGYCVFSADGADHVYWEQGTLNASTTQTISGLNWQSGSGTENENNENLLANSWMAPIYIKAMQSTDFVNAEATVYIFNSTSARAYESGGFEGNYSSYTVNTAEAVIPAMQSFSVFTTGSGASVKLDYDKIVYQPALAGTATPAPNKIQRRERKSDDEANKLRLFVRTESGLGDMLYMWEREDFSEAFENGWDGRKMYGESYAPQLYAITPDGAMAVNCVPSYEGVLIGFRAGTDEQTYTFSFEYDADAEPLYLYDKYADVYTRVLSGNTYQFVANDYDAHARFSLTHYMPGVATGMDAVSGQQSAVRCQKILLNERILILRDGKLYDVTGKTVK